MQDAHYIFIFLVILIVAPKWLIVAVIRYPQLLPVKQRDLVDPYLDLYRQTLYNKANQGKVMAKRMLTANEAEFYNRLKNALPEYDVIFQVAMGAIIMPTVSKDGPSFWVTMKSYHGQMIDFVLARRETYRDDELDAVLIIELDDWSHIEKREKDAVRDQRLADAGYPTIRWESRDKPGVNRIRKEVGQKIGVLLQPFDAPGDIRVME